jgi:hypothetical protein
VPGAVLERLASARLLARRLELALTPVVQLELVHEARAEDPQGGEERLDLVQRVRTCILRVDRMTCESLASSKIICGSKL